MLGVLCVRHKPWILNSISLIAHSSSAVHQTRLVYSPPIYVQFNNEIINRRRHHSNACNLSGSLSGNSGGAASIWHAILPSGGIGCECRRRRDERKPGEGSWNAAWDERPARWLHRADSAWLLFGVCSCLAPIRYWTDTDTGTDTNSEVLEAPAVVEHKINGDCDDLCEKGGELAAKNGTPGVGFKVTGVLADGRCLFRAIAHGACLKSGGEVPDDDRQRELADELRAQVVNELLKRREETEWFIEGDFDTYVKQIQQPYVWGGEPELLMASHVLKKLISVFMMDQSSGKLVNIANYGEEYGKDKESPINVLFHGYGHYDILETISEQR